MRNRFRCFNSLPEVIGLAVMMDFRYPLSLRQVEDLLVERSIDICRETVRFWWNRFDPMLVAEIRNRRVHHRSYSTWRWHLDEVLVRVTVKHITFGMLWIAKARCSRPWPLSAGLRLIFGTAR